MTACQRTIVIPSAPSREAAIEVAKQRFAELEGIRDWYIHASFIEAGVIEEDAEGDCETDERSSDHGAKAICIRVSGEPTMRPLLVATDDSDRVKHAVEAAARVGAQRKGRNHGP
jgi:hypothetical protein